MKREEKIYECNGCKKILKTAEGWFSHAANCKKRPKFANVFELLK